MLDKTRLFHLLFFSLCISLCLASVSIEYQTIVNPDKPFGCLDKKGNLRTLGEQWQEDNTCVMSRCLSVNHAQVLIYHTGCGAVATSGDKCRLVPQDLSKPYPGCCQTVTCDTEK